MYESPEVGRGSFVSKSSQDCPFRLVRRTAAIKDEAETVAAVKTKLVAAYTDARSTRECVFEVLNNCTDSG